MSQHTRPTDQECIDLLTRVHMRVNTVTLAYARALIVKQHTAHGSVPRNTDA